MRKRKKVKKKDKNKKAVSPKKETYPHFRHYKKSNHPALITKEHSPEEYNYKKVTSAAREAGRPNDKIEPNPDTTRKTPMYIGKRERHDKKDNFSSWKYPWKFPPKK